MNKKGEGNHWEIVSAVVLIFLVVIVVSLMYSDSFPKLKKGFEKIADAEAIKKAYSKTIGKEDALTEEEKNIIDKFNLFFRDNFKVEDDDCLKEINFDEVKGKGFGVRIQGGKIFAEKEERARVYQLNVPSRLLALYFDGNTGKMDDDFFIDENFEKINGEIELMDVIYIKDQKINFLDKATVAEFSGEFSDVMRKNVCGAEASERLNLVDIDFDVVSGTNLEEAQDIKDYLNDDFNYLGANYKVYEMIEYLLELNEQMERLDLGMLDFPIEKKFNLLSADMGDHLEEYFGEEYRGLPIPSENKCWLASIDRGDINEVITFGKSPGRNLRYRDTHVSLSDGSTINFRLLVSRDGCLPARKINMLLEIYRGKVP